jgi:hypothetical protein
MIDYEKKIDELLSQMTLKEKIGQCNLIEPFFLFEKLNKLEKEPFTSLLDERFLDKLLNEYNIGFLLFGGASSHGNDKVRLFSELF